MSLVSAITEVKDFSMLVYSKLVADLQIVEGGAAEFEAQVKSKIEAFVAEVSAELHALHAQVSAKVEEVQADVAVVEADVKKA